MLAFVMWGEDCVGGLLSLLLLSVSCGVMIFGCDGGFFLGWFFGMSGEVWIFLVDKSVIKVLFC